MKRSLIVVILVVLLAVGGFAATQYLLRRDVALESILPGQPLLFVHQKNVAENLKLLESHPAWRKLKEVDFDLLSAAKSKKPNQAAAVWTMLKDGVFTAENKDVFDKFFSKEVALVVYPTDVDFSKFIQGNIAEIVKTVQQVFNRISIVTKVGADVKAVEVLGRFSKLAGEETQREVVEYKKRSIHLVNFPQYQVKLGFTIIGDWMVLGLGDEAAKRSIDVYTKAQTPLAQDKFWQEKKTVAIDGEESFGYLDLGRLVGLIESASKVFSSKIVMGKPKPEEDIFQNFRGFHTVLVSGNWRDKFQSRTMVLYDKQTIDPEIAALYLACRDIPNQTLNFVPKGVLGYQWSNCTNPKYYWEKIKKEAYKTDIGAGTSLDDQVKAFEQMLGLSIENDIIPALGEEFGGYLADLEMMQAFPVPKLLLFLKIADQQKITSLLQKFTEQPMLVLQKETYRGTEIHYTSIPISAKLEPGYAFLNSYLLISVDRQLLHDAIDASQDPSGTLAKDSLFQKVDQGMTAPNSSTFFLRIDRLTDKLEELARWSQKQAEEKEIQQEAFRQGAEMRVRDIRGEIEQTEMMTTAMSEQVSSLEIAIKGMESRGEDATFKKNELTALRNDIELKKKDIETARLQEKEIQQSLEDFDEQAPSRALGTEALEKGVVPFLDGIGSLGVLGTWTKITDSAIDTMTVISGD